MENFFLLDEIDSESEREIACPAKRRRQDPNFLGVSDDESNHSLSRSSSLLQFESLEKQCQDISSSSPSIFSTYSFDSLENQRKTDLSPDSLERDQSDDGEPESDYYKSLKVDLIRPKRNSSRDSLLYNAAARLSDSDSSESTDSERTLGGNSKSTGSLKFSRSFDNLSFHKGTRDKMSAENLSEDSGYSDHLCNFVKNKSSSIPNLRSPCEKKHSENEFYLMIDDLKQHTSSDFYACDVEYAFQSISSNFGSSYQDLSVLDKYDVPSEYKSPLIERFMRNGFMKWRAPVCDFGLIQRNDAAVNIEKLSECDIRSAKYNVASASEPNLLQPNSEAATRGPTETSLQSFVDDQNYFENSVCVSSVPSDLNLAGNLRSAHKDDWSLEFCNNNSSIAAKNWDIADFAKGETCILQDGFLNVDMKESMENEIMEITAIETCKKRDSCSVSSASDVEMSSGFKREGSYMEAMSNRVDISDDEYNPCYTENIRKSTIVDFDKQILKTISETSIPSFNNSNNKLDVMFTSTPIAVQARNVVSTPNLAAFKNEGTNENFDMDMSSSSQNIPRKSSFANPSSSTSDEERTLTSTKSFSGSAGSKGVHFCPVVAEVNWHDNDSDTTTEKDSSYSISSTSDFDIHYHKPKPPTPPLSRVRARGPSPADSRICASEPELQNSDVESRLAKIDLNHQYIPLKPRTLSQPDVGVFKRKGSKVVRKDDDGSVLGNYVDGDGVLYKHSHLGDVYQSMPPTPSTSHVPTSSRSRKIDAPQSKLVEKEKHVKQQASAAAMEPAIQTRRDSKLAKSGKLGGFFSRLASFRFSSRKASEDKTKNKKKESRGLEIAKMPAQRIATKEDYIYIPLKGPDKVLPRDNNNQQVSKSSAQESADDAACISAKPPLPKVPPRVVGASVKRRTGEAFAQPVRPEHRTIDSGDALPRPMEPMGLIETDLDTEVTVITSGAHVKTRSLMNLGAEAPQRSLAAPPHPNRPHKSMEFLLDKQNLKVVEVSGSLEFQFIFYSISNPLVYVSFSFRRLKQLVISQVLPKTKENRKKLRSIKTR